LWRHSPIGTEKKKRPKVSTRGSKNGPNDGARTKSKVKIALTRGVGKAGNRFSKKRVSVRGEENQRGKGK